MDKKLVLGGLLSLGVAIQSLAIDCQTVDVYVENAQEISFSEYSTCGNEQFVLSNVQGVDLEWSIDGSYYNTGQTIQGYQTGNYKGYYEDGQGNCFETFDIYVGLGEAKQVSLVSDKEYVCSNETEGTTLEAVLSSGATSGVDYTWIKDQQFVEGTSENSLKIFEAGNYAVNVYDHGCTWNSNSKSLWQNANCPAVECGHDEAWESNGQYLGGNRIGVCDNYIAYNRTKFIEVYPPNDSNESVTWYHNGNVVDGSDNRIYFKSEGMYWAHYTTNEGTCFYTDTVEIVANSTIQGIIFNAGGDMCTAGEETLIAEVGSFSEQVSYAWYYGNEVLVSDQAGATHLIPELKVDKAGSYSLKINNGCQFYASYTVNPCALDDCNDVEIETDALKINDSTIELCVYDGWSEYLYVSGVDSDQEVSWFHSAGTSETQKSPGYSLYDLGQVYAYYTKDGECYLSDTLYVDEKYPEPVNLWANEYSLCPDDTIIIYAEWYNYNNHGVDFEWEKNAVLYEMNWAVSGAASIEVTEPGVYDFKPYGGNCISSDYSITIEENTDCTVTSEGMKLDDEILLAPNPTSDHIFVSAESVSSLSVLNVQMKEVLSNAGQQSIDVSALSVGSYWLKVVTPDGVVLKSFIKE